MGHGDAALDVQALHLVEHGRVRDVRVGAVDLARRDDAHRRRLRDHGADLHRAGVRAQEKLLLRALGGR